MRQSRLMSLVEVGAKVTVGYGVAVATQLLVFPHFGLEATRGQNLAIGAVFTGVSLARSYVLRRVFEALRARIDLKLVPLSSKAPGPGSDAERFGAIEGE